MYDVSVCIPAGGFWPELYFTMNSIASVLVHSRLTHEFIICANNTSDEMIEDARKSLLDPSTDFSKYHKVKFIKSDIPANGPAANRAAAVASGTFLCLTDSHVIVHPNIFTECIRVMEDHADAGLVHSPITWTGIPYLAGVGPGGFPFANNKRCYQYLYRTFDATGDWYLSRHFHGTYNHHLVSEKPYPIAGCGHGFYMMRRSVWEKIGGYHPGQMGYGGREAFVTFKSWLLGFRNYTVPTTNHIHYNGRRLYHWNMDWWYRNNMTQAYSIGGDKWLDIIYANFKKKAGVKAPVIERLRNEAVDLSVNERAFVLERQQMPFDDLFKVWDDSGVFY